MFTLNVKYFSFPFGNRLFLQRWLTWGTLDQAGLKLKSVCLYLSNAKIKGLLHHRPA